VIEHDPARAGLLARVNDVLALLESSPGDRRVRPMRFHEVGLRCVPVSHAADEWVVLWERRNDDAVVVHYGGPASFA
jgi:hypothetical protein